MAKIVVTLSSKETASNVKSSLVSARKNSISSFLQDAGSSLGDILPQATVKILNADDVAASTTITVDHTNMNDGDTIQIGSLVLTAKAAGASTNQFNIGVTNAATAINLSTAVSTYGSAFLVAYPSGATSKVTCLKTGTLGNAIPIIITQMAAGMSASGSALSGGVDDSAIDKPYNNIS